MDVGLRHSLIWSVCGSIIVSILVLVDVGLRHTGMYHLDLYFRVSILVLVDVGLRPKKECVCIFFDKFQSLF